MIHRFPSLALVASTLLAAAVPASGQTQAGATCSGGTGWVHVSHAAIWPDSCAPRDPLIVVEGRTIVLNGAASGEFCLQVLTPYTISGTVGPLCDGAWATRVVLRRFNGQVVETIDGPTVVVNCSLADFNDDCSLGVQDIFDFLAAYFAGDPSADVNGIDGVTIQDIFDYLVAYFGA